MATKISFGGRLNLGISGNSAHLLRKSGRLGICLSLLYSCTTVTPDKAHLWADLDESVDLRCSPWPENEDMGAVNDVAFRRPKNGELLVAGTGYDRKGRPALFMSPVSVDSDIPPELIVFKSLPSDALDLAGVRPEGGFHETGDGSFRGQAGTHELKWTLGGRGKDKKSTDFGVLRFVTSAPVESGRILPVEGGIFVVAITGDSLVGNAGLVSAWFPAGEERPAWQTVTPLPHTHLGDPVLMAGNEARQAILLVPKWVDRETTIGTYRLGPERLEARPSQGVFPAISLVVASARLPDGAAIMVRAREKDEWRYKLCEMNW